MGLRCPNCQGILGEKVPSHCPYCGADLSKLLTPLETGVTTDFGLALLAGATGLLFGIALVTYAEDLRSPFVVIILIFGSSLTAWGRAKSLTASERVWMGAILDCRFLRQHRSLLGCACWVELGVGNCPCTPGNVRWSIDLPFRQRTMAEGAEEPMRTMRVLLQPIGENDWQLLARVAIRLPQFLPFIECQVSPKSLPLPPGAITPRRQWLANTLLAHLVVPFRF